MPVLRLYRLPARWAMPCYTLAIALALSLAATLASGQTTSQFVWDLPPGVAPPRVPDSSTMTSERVELGLEFRQLFLQRHGLGACLLQPCAYAGRFFRIFMIRMGVIQIQVVQDLLDKDPLAPDIAHPGR
jgi:hypothetical protein